MKTWIALVMVTLFAVTGRCPAQSLVWPQFRGPGGSAVADGQKPPVDVGPDKNVKWKIPVPSGMSSPIVAGDKIVLTAFDGGKLYTIAYSRADGKEAWRKQAPAKQIEPFFKKGGSPAASTPVTDGERIYAYFGSCGVISYDLDGKQLWHYELPVSPTLGDFGTGTSPILVDNTIVIVRDQSTDSKLIAIDAVTGKLKWQKSRLSPASYSTPAVWEMPTGKQVVVAGHARLIGYDLESGTEKWYVNGIPSGCCASPVAADGMLLFAGWAPGGPEDEFKMPSYDDLLKGTDKNKDNVISKDETAKTMLEDFFDNQDANKDGRLTRDEWDTLMRFVSEGASSAFAVKSGGAGDLTGSHVLWKSTKGLPYIASALVYRGQFVMVKDGGMVSAYDPKTGRPIYLQQRVLAEGSYYASPVAANGHIYFTSLDDGTITVIKAGAAKAEVAARNPALGERVGATPAIADDTLYVRTAGHLYAFAEKK